MPSYEDRSLTTDQGRQRVCDLHIRSSSDVRVPDAKVEAYRRSVLHLNLISVVDGSEQNVLREPMSNNLLFAKIAEPYMTAVDQHFRDRLGKVDRGHPKMFTKLWNLRPYDKTNGEITRIPRLIPSYRNMKK